MISESTYKRIQYYLNEKNRLKVKPSKENEYLPLRGGILKCPNCNRNLTGYTANSTREINQHYYNCDNRLGCGFHCNATEANNEFVNHLKGIAPSPVIIKLFEKIIIKKYQSLHNTREKEIQELLKREREFKNRQDALLEKLVDDKIDQSAYDRLNTKYKEELELIALRIAEMPAHDEALDKYLSFSLSFLGQLHLAYEKADITVKKMILGSILSGNPVFDGKRYRTLEFKQSIALLSKSGKAFKKNDTKKRRFRF